MVAVVAGAAVVGDPAVELVPFGRNVGAGEGDGDGELSPDVGAVDEDPGEEGFDGEGAGAGEVDAEDADDEDEADDDDDDDDDVEVLATVVDPALAAAAADVEPLANVVDADLAAVDVVASASVEGVVSVDSGSVDSGLVEGTVEFSRSASDSGTMTSRAGAMSAAARRSG